MKLKVRTVAHQLEISNPVVEGISVGMMNMIMGFASAYPRPRHRAMMLNPYRLGTCNHSRDYPNPGPPLEYLDPIALTKAYKLGRVSRALPALPMQLAPTPRVPGSSTTVDSANASALSSDSLRFSVALPEPIMVVAPAPCNGGVVATLNGTKLLNNSTPLWLHYTICGGTSIQGAL